MLFINRTTEESLDSYKPNTVNGGAYVIDWYIISKGRAGLSLKCLKD